MRNVEFVSDAFDGGPVEVASGIDESERHRDPEQRSVDAAVAWVSDEAFGQGVLGAGDALDQLFGGPGCGWFVEQVSGVSKSGGHCGE